MIQSIEGILVSEVSGRRTTEQALVFAGWCRTIASRRGDHFDTSTIKAVRKDMKRLGTYGKGGQDAQGVDPLKVLEARLERLSGIGSLNA